MKSEPVTARILYSTLHLHVFSGDTPGFSIDCLVLYPDGRVLANRGCSAALLSQDPHEDIGGLIFLPAKLAREMLKRIANYEDKERKRVRSKPWEGPAGMLPRIVDVTVKGKTVSLTCGTITATGKQDQTNRVLPDPDDIFKVAGEVNSIRINAKKLCGMMRSVSSMGVEGITLKSFGYRKLSLARGDVDSYVLYGECDVDDRKLTIILADVKKRGY